MDINTKSHLSIFSITSISSLPSLPSFPSLPSSSADNSPPTANAPPSLEFKKSHVRNPTPLHQILDGDCGFQTSQLFYKLCLTV